MSLQHTRLGGLCPVRSLEISKPSPFSDADSIVEALLRQLEEHPNVHLISVFDELELMWERGGNIPQDLRAVQYVIFCFGAQADQDLLPLGARTIAVIERTDRFTVHYVETPVQELNDAMADWLKQLSPSELVTP